MLRWCYLSAEDGAAADESGVADADGAADADAGSEAGSEARAGVESAGTEAVSGEGFTLVSCPTFSERSAGTLISAASGSSSFSSVGAKGLAIGIGAGGGVAVGLGADGAGDASAADAGGWVSGVALCTDAFAEGDGWPVCVFWDCVAWGVEAVLWMVMTAGMVAVAGLRAPAGAVAGFGVGLVEVGAACGAGAALGVGAVVPVLAVNGLEAVADAGDTWAFTDGAGLGAAGVEPAGLPAREAAVVAGVAVAAVAFAGAVALALAAEPSESFLPAWPASALRGGVAKVSLNERIRS